LRNGNEKNEILFLKIWTNGSLTPKEALYEASRNLIDLFLPFLHTEEEGASFEENKTRFTPPLLAFQKIFTNLKKDKKLIPFIAFLLIN
jgi:DNA-directed RNA polymerase subunit alpha